MSGEGKVVCVTGASGFIASWLVKLLLQHGYTVKATVRDPNDPKKTDHLRALDGAKERLQLFKANLLEEGDFDPVVDGCEGVFHTASPVIFAAQNPQAELVEPAVKGTLNVLRSCTKFPSVKRVILTSSIASVLFNGKPLTADVVVDETWFSDPLYCESNKHWYHLSKTLAEEAAWKFARENEIDMVAINPGWVIGPMIQPGLALTVELFLKLIGEAQTFPNANYRFVDVRDVVHAHVQAFERPSASGRYCLVGKVTHVSEALNIVHELYPNLPLPQKLFFHTRWFWLWRLLQFTILFFHTRCEDDKPFVPNYEVSREKAKQLGIEFIPLEVTIKDTIEFFKEKGFITV